MLYYLTLERKPAPARLKKDNPDVAASAVELELALVTTTDDEALPAGRFEVMREYDEIPEAWDRFFPEILPGGRKGAVKRTGVYFGFSGSGTEAERAAVIEYMEGIMNEGA